MRAAIPLLLVCSLLAGCARGSKKTAAASRPILQPPTLQVTHAATGGTAPGYVFIGQKGDATKPSGAVIADNQGRVLWYHQVPAGLQVTDFRTQTYKGKPVLTWWQGKIATAGFGAGTYEIYDDAYHLLKTLDAGHGLQGDLHEFELTPRGTAYISIYRELPMDLSAVGGPKAGYMMDSVVQELDVETGKVIFQWDALDHVAVSESVLANKEPAQHASKKRAFDYFHVNSIADGPNNTVLVSGRDTSALYDVARDGHVVWRLGGKKSDFGPPAAVKFFFQHDGRFHPDGTLSLFDNGGIPRLEPYTRPEIMRVDLAAKRVSVVRTYLAPGKYASPFEGNLELLPGGGAFVGWGGVPKATEFDARGKVDFELKLPYGDTYRAYRLPWSGDPGGKPSVALKGRTAYASWNGKLGIATWEVRDGSKVVATVPWGGLVTTVQLPSVPKELSVRALDASGSELGAS